MSAVTAQKQKTHSPTVARKRQRRKDEILAVALGLVAGGGLEGLTIHALAKELGLTPGALYRYFRSKAAILSALETLAMERLLERLRARLDRLPCSDEPQLLSLVAAAQVYLRMPTEDPEVAKLITALLGDPRRLITTEDLPEVGRVFLDLFGTLIDMFDAAQRESVLDPGNARERAVVFWSGLQGIAQLDKMTRIAPGFFDIEPMGMELCHSLLRGWGADAERLTTTTDILSNDDLPTS